MSDGNVSDGNVPDGNVPDESVADRRNPDMLYGLEDRPPVLAALLAGLQHVLAVFGGILTAPLIVAVGMGLSVADTSYLVSSALVISGAATFIQIQRVGLVGSGLLSIQGTSYSFIGPLIAAFYFMNGADNPHIALGTIFGSAVVCSLMVAALSFLLPRLGDVVTPNVTGATVILIGAALVWATLNNIFRVYMAAGPGEGWRVLLMSGMVFGTVVAIVKWGNPWLKLCSITIGLLTGYLVALSMGLIEFSKLDQLDNFFIPDVAHYPMSVDVGVIMLLLPIFMISMMESVGDLTATSSLSGLPTKGREYWARMRGGVLGDAVNSAAASVFCTFPNTTFSQNNGVIQLTGVCSRYVGFYVAGLLVFLGLFPIVGGIFQIIPEAVLHGATLLMFFMVGYAGFRIVQTGQPSQADWLLVAVSVMGGWILSLLVADLSFLPGRVIAVLEFPVSTGALIALSIEFVRFLLNRQRSKTA